MNIDLGGWLNNSKIWVPVTEVLKIPSQNAKLLNAIENPRINVAQEKAPKTVY